MLSSRDNQPTDNPSDDINDFVVISADQAVENKDTTPSLSEDDFVIVPTLSEQKEDRHTLLSPAIPKAEGLPLRVLKSLLKIILSSASAAPTAINALMLMSGQPAKNIGKAWWESMSRLQQVFTVINAGSSEYVNAKLNIDFFSQLFDKLKTNFKKSIKSPKNALITLVSLFFGLGGGLAAGAIAYDSFIWLPGGVFAFTAFNASVYFASRYLSMNRAFSRIDTYADTQLQREVIDKFNHLKQEYLSELQTALDKKAAELLESRHSTTASKSLTPDDFEELFITMGEKISNLATESNAFNEKTKLEIASRMTGLMFDVVFATLIGTMALGTFTQKGFQGIETLTKLISGAGLNDLSSPAKIAAGLVGGIPSGTGFGLGALEFRELLVDAVNYLRKNPRDTGAFLFEWLTNLFASTGMFNLGARTLGPNNLFQVPSTPATFWGAGIGNAVGGLVVNIGPTLKTYRRTPNAKQPKAEEIADFFHNPNICTVKPETAQTLRQYNLFRPATTVVTDPKENLNLAPGHFVVQP